MEAVKADGKPVALCYGKEDPWIQPIWGHRAKRVLTEVLATPTQCTLYCTHKSFYKVFHKSLYKVFHVPVPFSAPYLAVS
jgi:hypothetical protein